MPKGNSYIKAVLLGVPMDLGAGNIGVAAGPDAFRKYGLIERLLSAGLKISDAGNVQPKSRNSLKRSDPRLKYLDEIVRVSEQSAMLVDEAIQHGQKAIVLGGDHSISLGAFSGASVALRGNLGLIYIDAHADLNTDKTTPTGNIHGMHLASLIGLGTPDLKNVYGKSTKLVEKELLLIAGCDYDTSEIELIAQRNIAQFSLLDLLMYGLAPLFEMIDKLACQAENIWVSLDLDSINEQSAPAAAMPNRRGLTYREAVAIAEYIGKNCNVIGMDLVEYNPDQDTENKTAELAIELIAKTFGCEYSWYSNYLNRNKV